MLPVILRGSASHVRSLQGALPVLVTHLSNGARRKSARAAMLEEDREMMVPIDFQSSTVIQGNESQTMTVELRRNQVLRTMSGSFIFMTEGVDMKSTLGLRSMPARISADNLMLTDYTISEDSEKDSGTVILGAGALASIVRVPMAEHGHEFICANSFLAANATIKMSLYMTGLLTGFTGGSGFLLSRLKGEGTVFVTCRGSLIRRKLGDKETLRVSPGCIVGFSSTVDFRVEPLDGLTNMTANKHLFLALLTGPGTVLIQSVDVKHYNLKSSSESMLPSFITGAIFGGTSEHGTVQDTQGHHNPQHNSTADDHSHSDGTPAGLFGSAAPKPENVIKGDLDDIHDDHHDEAKTRVVQGGAGFLGRLWASLMHRDHHDHHDPHH